MTSITTQIRELQNLPVNQLAGRYEALFGKPPRVRNAAWLRRQVAWQMQAREFGGLPDRAKARLDELIQDLDVRLGPPPPPTRQPAARSSRDPMIGTTLVREWHGQQIRVEVHEDGFEWNSTMYRSLSGLAKAITGSAWNGRLFFGLVQRRARR